MNIDGFGKICYIVTKPPYSRPAAATGNSELHGGDCIHKEVLIHEKPEIKADPRDRLSYGGRLTGDRRRRADHQHQRLQRHH